MWVKTESEGAWRFPETTSYTNEAELETLLEALIISKAEVLSGLVEGIAVVRQFQLPNGGRIDLVGVDRSGQVLLVECKLDKNSEAKKAIIGQVLWYAAEVSSLSPSDFVGQFEQRLKGKSRGAATLSEIIKGYSDEDFLAGLTQNLKAGTFQLMVVVDHINDQLRRTIEYVNQHAPGVGIVALELQYSKEGSVQMLLPKVFGKELADMKPKPSPKAWTLELLRDDLKTQSSDPSVGRLVELLDWCGQKDARFNPGISPRVGVSFEVEGVTTTVLMVSSRTPAVEVCFAYLNNKGVSHSAISKFRENLAKTSASAHFSPGVETAILKLDAQTALGSTEDLQTFKGAIAALLLSG